MIKISKSWQHGLKDGAEAVAFEGSGMVWILETRYGDTPQATPAFASVGIIDSK